MYSWWNRGASSSRDNVGAGAGGVLAERRTVRTRQVHVEVIGGAHLPSAAISRPRQDIVGPPRIPYELISTVVIMAARSVSCEDGRQDRQMTQRLLRLASVSRAAHRDIHVNIILPDLRLQGIKQIVSFARTLASDSLNMRHMAAKIARLTVCRADSSRKSGRGSLYDDIEDTAKFERATLSSLRTILSHCTGLQYLSLDMTARVLDLRWPEDMSSRRVMDVCNSLKELVTMLSLYGGDMNERLWDPSYGSSNSLTTSRWASLTHLQLHGPRFRMTAMTALALCGLPNITHLCLIMPWIIQAIPESVSPEVLRRHARQVDRAVDAAGQETVLQLLYSGLGHVLQELTLVCHDAEGYVGSVAKLGPMFRALQWWEEGGWCERRASSSPTMLKLVTVSFQSRLDDFHPSMLSRWMMERAQLQQHWTFEDRLQGTNTEGCFTMYVESCKAPTAYEPERREERGSQRDHSRDTAISSTMYQSQRSEVDGGIDNLD